MGLRRQLAEDIQQPALGQCLPTPTRVGPKTIPVQWRKEALLGLSQQLNRLIHSRQRLVFSYYSERFEKRRRVLASTDRNPNWLEHLSGFKPQFLRRRAQSLIES